MNTDTGKQPWYRVPMVWLIIVFPAASVVMGMTILYFAITTYDGLVVDDYYKQGKNINRTLARDHAARSHGLQGALDIRPGQRLVQVQLAATNMKVLPPSIKLSFLHATRAGFDHAVFAAQMRVGVYEAALPDLVAGHWTVQAEDDDWRLLGSLFIPGDGRATLVPGNAP